MAVFLAGFWFGGVSMANTVNCTTWDPVAKIWDWESAVCYGTLVDAINSVQKDGTAIIELLKDASWAWVFIEKDSNKTITVDLKKHTYTCDWPAVWSQWTETQAWHLEKNNNITIKNGILKSAENSWVEMLVQNYSNLTLENVTLDGSALPWVKPYTLSNNNWSIVIWEGTEIIANDGWYAFDVCVTNYYPDWVTVTVKSWAKIKGIVQYDVWWTKPAQNNAKLIVEWWEFDWTFEVEEGLIEDAKSNLNIKSWTFSKTVPVEYLDEDASITVIGAEAQIWGVQYKTLSDAIGASKDGDTVLLLKEASIDSKFDSTKKITIDLNWNDAKFSLNVRWWSLSLTWNWTISPAVWAVLRLYWLPEEDWIIVNIS